MFDSTSQTHRVKVVRACVRVITASVILLVGWLLGRSLSHANKQQLFGNQYILHCVSIHTENHLIKTVAACTSRRTLHTSQQQKQKQWMAEHTGPTMTHRLCIQETHPVCRCGAFKLIIMFGSTHTLTVVPFKSWWDLQLLMSITTEEKRREKKTDETNQQFCA